MASTCCGFIARLAITKHLPLSPHPAARRHKAECSEHLSLVIGRLETVLIRSHSKSSNYDEGRVQASDSAGLFVQANDVFDIFFVAFQVEEDDSLADWCPSVCAW